MSDLDDQFGEGVIAQAKALNGVTVTYTPEATGVPASVAAVSWTYETPNREHGEYAIRTECRARVVIEIAVLAAPAIGDSITYGGDDWTVATVEPIPGSCNRLHVVASDVERRGQPNSVFAR